jgi:hypothetical protein
MFVSFMALVTLASLWLAWPSLVSLWHLVGLPAPVGWTVASLFGHDDVAEEWYPDTSWTVAKAGAASRTGWHAMCLAAAHHPEYVLGGAALALAALFLPDYLSLGGLVLVRGLPGSGKSTWSTKQGAPVISADDWFTHRSRDGLVAYLFDPAQLPQAHADCLARAKAGLALGQEVYVANTFTQAWELAPYLALDPDAKVFVCPPVPGRLGVHGVPQETWDRMAARWEDHPGETTLPPQV